MAISVATLTDAYHRAWVSARVRTMVVGMLARPINVTRGSNALREYAHRAHTKYATVSVATPVRFVPRKERAVLPRIAIRSALNAETTTMDVAGVWLVARALRIISAWMGSHVPRSTLP